MVQFLAPETNVMGERNYIKAHVVCPDMKVHGHTVDRVDTSVYLGDVIRQDGSNTSNIKDWVSKGMGQMNTIMTLLKAVSFGEKYFEIAVTLREAHLINGMMSSAETWYGLRKQEIDQMEEVDKMLIRKILDAPISSCIESLYLELDIIPIHILLKARRINYFHYLVNLKESLQVSAEQGPLSQTRSC